jgi:hypothetical protein
MQKIIILTILLLVSHLMAKSQCVGTTSMAITINTCSGIDDNNQNTLQAYPNPASESVTIVHNSMNGNNEIEVTDILGQKIDGYVVLKNNHETLELNIAKLANGVYFVRFTNGQKAKIVKL